jgi:hypothetical protein
LLDIADLLAVTVILISVQVYIITDLSHRHVQCKVLPVFLEPIDYVQITDEASQLLYTEKI